MKLTTYLKETREELKHVSWPVQKQVVSFTALVIVISILVAVFLDTFDVLFTRILDYII